MTTSEIKANELIAEAIDKIIVKYQKKADKERAKIKQASVTYKGEKYYSESELMDAYSCDVFSNTTYDRLLDKLNKEKNGISGSEMTESEIMIFELSRHRNNLLHEIAVDKQQKERQSQINSRMRDLMEEGYSYKEAKTIIGNEEHIYY